MLAKFPRPKVPLLLALTAAVGGSLFAATGASAASARDHGGFLQPGNLLVSGSVYQNDPGLLTPGVTILPPGCTSGCATATNDGSYPGVFNNDLVDASFGVTSPVFLDQLTQSDPNKVVTITDNPGAQTLPAESFRTFQAARSGEVLRGVSFTPGTFTTR
jgi:hypothetical protein